MHNQLAFILGQYLFQEKLLVVPSMDAGNIWLESLKREGITWANLRPITPICLAIEIIKEDVKQRRLRLIKDQQKIYLLNKITGKMNERRELVYFKNQFDRGVLSQEILPVVENFRMSVTFTEAVSPKYFADQQKGREIARILNDYDLALEENGFIDDAMVFAKAYYILESDLSFFKNKIVLFTQQIETYSSVINFLKIIKNNIGIILAQEPILLVK